MKTKYLLSVRLFLVTSFLLSSTLYASPLGKSYGIGPFIGGLYLDLGNLNEKLQDAGYDKLNSVYTIAGIEGYIFISQRILLSGFAVDILSQSVESASGNAHFNGGFGFAEIGYAVIKTENYTLSPLIGIGGGAISLSMYSMVRQCCFR